MPILLQSRFGVGHAIQKRGENYAITIHLHESNTFRRPSGANSSKDRWLGRSEVHSFHDGEREDRHHFMEDRRVNVADYGSAGGHCNIEIEADNSILDNAYQFLQRVKDAYEMARQSVEEELLHHRPNGNTGQRTSQQKTEPARTEPAQQRQEYRQDYRNDNAGGNRVASPKQQQFIASLVKGVKGLNWKTLDNYCSVQFGKNTSQLTPKEASALIEDLKAAKSGERSIAV